MTQFHIPHITQRHTAPDMKWHQFTFRTLHRGIQHLTWNDTNSHSAHYTEAYSTWHEMTPIHIPHTTQRRVQLLVDQACKLFYTHYLYGTIIWIWPKHKQSAGMITKCYNTFRGSLESIYYNCYHIWFISRSSQYYTAGITKAVVCVILSVGWFI